MNEDSIIANGGSRDSEDCEEPRGELERIIWRAWSDAFAPLSIRRDDNYFELGGNSLQGLQLAESLTHRLRKEITVVMIFQYPSVRELAEFVAGEDRGSPD